MASTPRRSDAPRIRGALKLYKVTSIITGSFLLLLCLMMLFRYGFGVDIELGGPFGFLALTPKEQITGINLSTVILIVHGWLYVLYLYSDFRLWSLARWPFWKFLVVASGGVIPVSSFIIEHFVHRDVVRLIDKLETPVEVPA
jgi:integral membrane protein